jgi:hypothetical protein
MFELAFEHPRRDVRVLDAEQPAEPAALVVGRHALLSYAVDRIDDRTRLAIDTKTACEMTRRMIRDRRLQPRAGKLLEMVRDEGAELDRTVADRFSARPPDGVPFELGGLLVNDHVAARSGRDHDRAVSTFEHFDRVTRGRARGFLETGVERRLAAAGLIERDVDGETEVLQYLDHGEADVREELVDEAGVEE